MKILVTGSQGQLGSEFRVLSQNSGHEFIFCDLAEMDLSKENDINRFLSENTFDIVINCGAYTNVDGAEDNEALAYKINAVAPGIIAKYCSEYDRRLIHISTDYVFDGKGNQPISELEKPNALSVYGLSKLQGEENIHKALDNAYVIRTSWVYSSFGNNFVKTMLRLGRERNELRVIYDQIGTPTYAADLAAGVMRIIDQLPENDQPGTYHYSNLGVLSWYDFAQAIFELTNIKCNVTPIRSSEYPVKATRPSFSLLDKRKVIEIFGLTIPYWRDSLKICLKRLEK